MDPTKAFRRYVARTWPFRAFASRSYQVPSPGSGRTDKYDVEECYVESARIYSNVWFCEKSLKSSTLCCIFACHELFNSTSLHDVAVESISDHWRPPVLHVQILVQEGFLRLLADGHGGSLAQYQPSCQSTSSCIFACTSQQRLGEILCSWNLLGWYGTTSFWINIFMLTLQFSRVWLQDAWEGVI